MNSKSSNRLSEPNVRDVQAGNTTHRLYDGGGLLLLIQPSGSKWWRFKYRFGGKQKSLSLGVYPGVGLAQARERRDEVQRMLSMGVDPARVRKEERIAQRGEQDRLAAATRFAIDSDGALSFRLGTRTLNLTATETAELRAFMDATHGVIPRG
ncbi:Arm DNA-binding domain-containing protein [Paraburkholderia hospita]|uniref:Arm DNA-binding domain-containing protein n=1 Tax=Paraburkholderia hospita TaxID=169430 RepID=UPI000271BFD1|nr:Arm DNA-binding domain-containing protein [Paraburkholderia hospita]EUC21484.1 protein of unknown function DUF4102 [Burkholderia sp. BT03]SKC95299.1 protein of unknown function [Paraburkholderia hospita]